MIPTQAIINVTQYGTIKLQWVTLMIAWVGIILFYWILDSSLVIQIITLMLVGLGLGGAMTTHCNFIVPYFVKIMPIPIAPTNEATDIVITINPA